MCLWPICRRTSRPTTPRHIYYGHHARKRTPWHSVAAATTTTTTRVCLCTRVYVWLALLRVVVKVSHLLAACGPLHSPVHASRLSSFKVYYVLREEHRAPSWLYKGRPSRARLYLTRVYTQRTRCCSACVDLVFTKFWVAISPHRDAISLICDTAALRTTRYRGGEMLALE